MQRYARGPDTLLPFENAQDIQNEGDEYEDAGKDQLYLFCRNTGGVEQGIDGFRSLLFSRKQLGLGHLMGNGLRRIVERELIFCAPGEHRESQPQQHEGKPGKVTLSCSKSVHFNKFVPTRLDAAPGKTPLQNTGLSI